MAQQKDPERADPRTAASALMAAAGLEPLEPPPVPWHRRLSIMTWALIAAMVVILSTSTASALITADATRDAARIQADAAVTVAETCAQAHIDCTVVISR